MFSPTNLSPKNKGIQDSGSFFNDENEFSDAFSEGTATMVTQKQLKVEKLSTVSKSEYENLENCLICNISFEKFGNLTQHHCRACGGSVCGPCSRRQINGNRVCDLCFLRCFIKKTEQRRKDQLNIKKKAITQLKEQQETIKEQISQVQKDITDIKDNKFYEVEQLRKTLQHKQDEQREIEQEVIQHEEILNKAELQFTEEKQKQKDLEKQQAVYETQLNGIIVDLEQKKKIIEQKQNQVKSLVDQKNKLTNTKSFLNYKKDQQHETYNESDEENDDENQNEEEGVEQSVNPEKKERTNSQTNHYTRSSIAKRKPYELNEKQANNDKCYCSIF